MFRQDDGTQADLTRVRGRISAAAAAAGRRPEEITLLAVSKTFGVDAVAAVLAAGQHRFGENYVQEGVEKIRAIARHCPGQPVEWHFIGPLQSNKTRPVAEHFDWVQTIDRLRVAERLSEQRPAHLPALQVLVQVNVSGEASKSGVPPAEAGALLHAVAALPRLRVRGLMAIPAPADDPAAQRAPLDVMKRLFDALRADGAPVDTLSMGMSADLEAAVAAGATMVRIGTAIFGARQ